MSITIVVGGQYGGEGKGKVTYNIAQERNIKITVRIGGTNSGHTIVTDENNKFILRQLPTTAIIPHSISVLSAGSYIDLSILKKEIELTGISQKQLFIDQNAMIITQEDKDNELKNNLRESIGSTASGTGASVIRRISRDKKNLLARDIEELKPYIIDSKKFLYEQIQKKQKILIEGTQGYGLSLLHSPHYPYCTSRDTTAAGFLAEIGLSPFDVEDIILTIRTYPIRVEGNSGELKNEINWERLKLTPEFTSVTKKTRRIGEFDLEIVSRAIMSNRPTTIVLNHLDYIEEKDRKEFIQNIEKRINQKINYIGLDDKCIIKM
ncbi:adenylosuccinate synthetase [Aliarcobacter butzleri]|uniref:adenylosuccinate synthetase n=1 Tax=Aliarcobacter butzleri TaxID=28197 RepID=UPI0021B2413B|nr:adenylosuccinate synthetase [Aliarcobacter butzleri]MCT7594869.1 adenylosuccinate synthetase [Aliarcobacter butzleri]MCT7599330.1 adenylosuccinate synthetase [Aliarcobacter butzleri]